MKTILVAEDDEMLRELLVMDLEGLGYNCIPAQDGEVALAVFQKEKIDCILTDLDMPKLDGRKLLSEIRKTHPDLPITCFLSDLSDASIRRSIASGFNEFIAKPFKSKQLELVLNQASREIEKKEMNHIKKENVFISKTELPDSPSLYQEGASFHFGRRGFLWGHPRSHASTLPLNKITFQIPFENGTSLQGEGVLRWKNYDQKTEWLAIQIESLTPSSFELFYKVRSTWKRICGIPEDPTLPLD